MCISRPYNFSRWKPYISRKNSELLQPQKFPKMFYGQDPYTLYPQKQPALKTPPMSLYADSAIFRFPNAPSGNMLEGDFLFLHQYFNAMIPSYPQPHQWLQFAGSTLSPNMLLTQTEPPLICTLNGFYEASRLPILRSRRFLKNFTILCIFRLTQSSPLCYNKIKEPNKYYKFVIAGPAGRRK